MKITRRTFLMGSIALPLILEGSPSSLFPTSTKSSSTVVDRSRLLACLAEVETGNDDTKIGPCGSRSRYQIHRNTWYDYTTLNFERYCWGRTALDVAHYHLDWLINHLDRPSPFRLAHAWHRGLSAKTQASGFAYRVHNLYHDSDFLTAAFLNNNNDEFATAYRPSRPQSFPTNSTR